MFNRKKADPKIIIIDTYVTKYNILLVERGGHIKHPLELFIAYKLEQ